METCHGTFAESGIAFVCICVTTTADLFTVYLYNFLRVQSPFASTACCLCHFHNPLILPAAVVVVLVRFEVRVVQLL